MLHAFKSLPVTFTLILLSCFVSIITWFGAIHATLYWFVFDIQLIQHGQLWRAITPIFLHFPAMDIVFAHLAFNMIWLYQFGSLIERADSGKFLLLLVVISGLISNIAQSLVSIGIFGGMSGVVYALLGYLFVRPRLSPRYLAQIPDNIAYFLIGFMVLASLGLFGSSIANTAHYVGFICGVVTAVIRAKVIP